MVRGADSPTPFHSALSVISIGRNEGFAKVVGSRTEDQLMDPEVIESTESTVAEAVVVEDELVEEVSIDGMCGVY
ncbi:hypothetical protein GCM10022200_18100 [Microbacterium awajiense]|uniref:Mycofactocin n=1 Tax=Microbacterium awajiense TaxID=415214 RepID=A0ABP7ALX6_9MICO